MPKIFDSKIAADVHSIVMLKTEWTFDESRRFLVLIGLRSMCDYKNSKHKFIYAQNNGLEELDALKSFRASDFIQGSEYEGKRFYARRGIFIPPADGLTHAARAAMERDGVEPKKQEPEPEPYHWEFDPDTLDAL